MCFVDPANDLSFQTDLQKTIKQNYTKLRDLNWAKLNSDTTEDEVLRVVQQEVCKEERGELEKLWERKKIDLVSF